MKYHTLPLFLAVFFFVFAGLFGCASKQPPQPVPQAGEPVPAGEPAPAVPLSGFLDPPPDFKAGSKGMDLVYTKEGADFASYDKILLDPLTFYLKDDPKYKDVHVEKLKVVSDAYRKAVADALGTAYPLVDEPGPGVLRVRAAIIHLVANRPGLIAAMVIIPGGSLAYVALPEKCNNIGSASMEAEALDSLTGERLAAAVAHRSGKKTEFFEGLSKWGHVKKAFTSWAQQFRGWLDETHGKTPPAAAAGTHPASPR
jgi:hypothetical protein